MPAPRRASSLETVGCRDDDDAHQHPLHARNARARNGEGTKLRCAVATFTRVNLSEVYTHSRGDQSPWDERTAWGVARLPGGDQSFWGVPFSVGGADPDAPGLLVVGNDGSTEPARLALAGVASYIVVAHLCDARARTSVAGQTSDYPNPVVTAPGEHLADYVLEYADGSEHRVAVRRRFEVNQVMARMQSGFLSRPHQG